MRVVVSGASGLIGSALLPALRAAGHRPIALVRRPPRAEDEIEWDPAASKLAPDALDGADAVVHLAGAGIGDHRWTAEYKRELLDSRTLSTALLADTIARAATGPRVLLSGSAIGYYGPRGDETLDESSPAGTDFLADVCRQWEDACQPARDAGARVVNLRTGIVLSAKGGALKKMLPLFRLGAGGRFGNGRQWQSWISIDDEVQAIIHLLTSALSGPVNLTAPTPVSNTEFSRTLAKVLHRPSLVPVPRFAPALLLGGELADALLFTGQRVLPAALQADGYAFEHGTLDVALRAVLDR